jgi:hypothetical protein
MTEPADKTPEQSKTRFIGYPGSEMGVFAAEPVDRGVIALRAFFALTGRVVLYTLLAGAFAFFVFMSFRYPDGAVEQSLFVELSSGTALFLAAPFMLAVTAKRRPLAYTTLTTLSAVLALLAFHSEGLTQSFLVEASMGMVLILALDFTFRRLEKLLLKALVRTQKDTRKLDETIAEASARDDERFATLFWHNYWG